MKVVLLQDVDNIGKKFEVKEVKDGYARNFLIPKKLVKLATQDALKWVQMQKDIKEEKAEQDLKTIEEIVSQIDGFEVIIPVKVGDKDQLFEKITAQKIVDKMKEDGFNIDKNQIDLEKPIEEIGDFNIKVKFEHNLEAEIKVIVSEDKS